MMTGKDADSIVVQVRRDGKVLETFISDDFDAESRAFMWLLKHQGQSVYWATTSEGYGIVQVFANGDEENLY